MMTSNDMDQIRDLLIGDFSQEIKNQLKVLDERLTQLHEDNRQAIETLSTTLDAKINKIYKISNEKNESLKLMIEQRLSEQNSITQDEFTSIENRLNTQNISTQKALTLLKSRVDANLTSLQEDNNRKNVSKESLASLFLEYSLKLKDTNLADKIKDKTK